MVRSLEAPSASRATRDLAVGHAEIVAPGMAISTAIPQTVAQKARRRAMVVPREHGAWGMLLIPLATGAVAGTMDGGRVLPVVRVTTVVLALFWLRTPAESWLGTTTICAGTRDEKRLVLQVIVPLVIITAANATALFWREENLKLLPLGAFAGVVCVVQALLKRVGRTTRAVSEVIGALALTSTAPAAYYVATGQLNPKAWALWGLNWLFAADQIYFVWLRMRGARVYGWRDRFAMGWSFVVGQLFLAGVLTAGCGLGWLPVWTLVAFAPILLRGFAWFVMTAKPIIVRRLGWTELAHALVFGVLITTAFSLGH